MSTNFSYFNAINKFRKQWNILSIEIRELSNLSNTKAHSRSATLKNYN